MVFQLEIHSPGQSCMCQECQNSDHGCCRECTRIWIEGLWNRVCDNAVTVTATLTRLCLWFHGSTRCLVIYLLVSGDWTGTGIEKFKVCEMRWTDMLRNDQVYVALCFSILHITVQMLFAGLYTAHYLKMAERVRSGQVHSILCAMVAFW